MNNNNKPVHYFLINLNATNYIVFKAENSNSRRNSQFTLRLYYSLRNKRRPSALALALYPTLTILKKRKV